MYGFVLNNPISEWDVLGLTAKDDAFKALNTLKSEFKGTILLKDSWFGGLIDDLLMALKKISFKYADGNPTYYVTWHQMTLPKNFSNVDVLHESVHAWNDKIGSATAREDEGMAYGTQYMYSMLLKSLHEFEKELQKGQPNLDNVRKLWKMSWLQSDSIYKMLGQYTSGYFIKTKVQFNIAPSDITRIKNKLGLCISCDSLAAKYNKKYKGKLNNCLLSCENKAKGNKTILPGVKIPDEFK